MHVRILVVTSCTGQKAVDHEHRLTLADFALGPDHVAQREAELRSLLTPARELYTGQQHVRLMRGVGASARSGSDISVDLYIASAGYGLVEGSRQLAPYEATFQGMKRADLRKLAQRLDLPQQVHTRISQPFDLIVILLGDDYLDACQITADTAFGGPALILCGREAATKLPSSDTVRIVTLANADAKRFSCGLVGLKGELASILLQDLADDPSLLKHLFDPETDVLSSLSPRAPVPDPRVDWVVHLSGEWLERSRARPIKYFIPDWSDLVDPDYDFEHDRPSHSPAHWTNQVYAHQLYGEPQYDGILVSHAVLDESNAETIDRLRALGVHRYLRVPDSLPVMGDCGAFAYVRDDRPPYTTEDVLTYYTQLGFDLGVSVDHLIPPYRPTGVDADSYGRMKRERYELTIANAEAFLRAHGGQLPWTPVGAVQGWDATSYAAAAKHYVSLGYRYIALGAMVPRARHPHLILPILEAVHEVVQGRAQIHLFGVATAGLLPYMRKFGITSADSASMLRKAWEGHSRNYLTPDGWYPAIRIPPTRKQHAADLRKLEAESLRMLRAFTRGSGASLSRTARLLAEYDHYTRPGRRDNESVDDIAERVTRILQDQPWTRCPCPICTTIGVEVIIFRGNNRNRRRGFHNTHVFYQQLARGPFDLDLPSGQRQPVPGQLSLLSPLLNAEHAYVTERWGHAPAYGKLFPGQCIMAPECINGDEAGTSLKP